ncbi:MAG: tyrosine-type recombinase/integrase [SAR324 cluster bacterium]|nr:tyrosine-type recombinase/integrase [SAR324 cluster bacterium]
MNLIPTVKQNQSALLLKAFYQNKSPATLKAYRQDLESFRGFLDVPTVEQASQFLIRQPHGKANLLALNFKAWLKEKDLSPNSVNRKLAGLRSLVKLANTIGLISWKLEVPNENTESYRDTRGPGKVAYQKMLKKAGESKNEVKALRDIAILKLLHDLALRRSSLVNLDMSDLELDRQALWVTLKRRSEKKLKTLPVTTQKALEAWLDLRGSDAGPVFTNLDRAGKGHRLTGSGLYYLVKGYGKKVGVKTRPHGLRHQGITTAVIAAKDAGIGLEEVLDYSDHSSVGILMIYRDRERNVQGKLAELVASESP